MCRSSTAVVGDLPSRPRRTPIPSRKTSPTLRVGETVSCLQGCLPVTAAPTYLQIVRPLTTPLWEPIDSFRVSIGDDLTLTPGRGSEDARGRGSGPEAPLPMQETEGPDSWSRLTVRQAIRRAALHPPRSSRSGPSPRTLPLPQRRSRRSA